MKNDHTQKLRIYKLLAFLTLFVGTVLVVYMITVESELGALPLFLIITGTVWFIITQYRIKKSLQNNKD